VTEESNYKITDICYIREPFKLRTSTIWRVCDFTAQNLANFLKLTQHSDTWKSIQACLFQQDSSSSSTSSVV